VDHGLGGWRDDVELERRTVCGNLTGFWLGSYGVSPEFRRFGGDLDESGLAQLEDRGWHEDPT